MGQDKAWRNQLRLALGPLLTWLFVFLSYFADALAQESPQFSDSSQRLMAVILAEGDLLSDGLIIYPDGLDRWYLPLGEFSEALGIAVQANNAIGQANGYILEESNSLELDVKKCQVIYAGKKEVFSCRDVLIYDGDIYIELSLVERIYPLKLHLDSLRSQLMVTTFKKLPIQQRNERGKQSISQVQEGRRDSGYPQIETPISLIDGFVLDQQISANYLSSPERQSTDLRQDTAIAGELLGFEAHQYLSGDQKKIANSRTRLVKKDHESKLLGPFKASSIELVDYSFPSAPLIGGGGLVRGALISSFQDSKQSQFGVHDFVGEAADGWEIELYQNDILIGRQISKQGRYEFLQVPLFYGVNRFRIEFYGPQGQRKQNYESYDVDQSLITKGKGYYLIATGEDENKNQRNYFQYDHSLTDRLTLSAGYVELSPDKVSKNNYSFIGARGFLKNFYGTTTYSQGPEKGFIWGSSLKTPLFGTMSGLGYSKLYQYQSPLYKRTNGSSLTEMFQFNTSFNFFLIPSLRMTFESSDYRFEDKKSEIEYTHRVSTRLGPFYVFNSVTYDQSSSNTTGEASALAQVKGNEIRTTYNYQPHAAVSYGAEISRKVYRNLSLTLGAQNLVVEDIRKTYLSLNRVFDELTLSGNAEYDSRNKYNIGLLLSYSFDFDSTNRSIRMNSQSQSELGLASVLVYYDKNQNGIFDQTDEPLPNIELTVNQQETGVRTDREGQAYLRNLPSHESLDISISLRSLDDPFFKPDPAGYKMILRPGKMGRVELPIVLVGEVSGMVKLEDKTGKKLRGAKNILVQLKDKKNQNIVHKTKTEVDGYFSIVGIRPGQYSLQVDTSSLDGMNIISGIQPVDILMTDAGIDKDVVDFRIVVKSP